MIEYLNNLNLSNVMILSVILVVSLAALFFHWKDGDFDLRQLVLDSTTNRISPEKTTYMGAFTIGSWALITMVQKSTLTEWYLLAYLGTFAAGRGLSQALSVWNNKGTKPIAVPEK